MVLNRTSASRSAARMLTLACVAVLVSAGAANATAHSYWSGNVGPNDKKAGPSSSGFRISAASAESYSRRAEAAAHHPGGWDLYGNWVGGWGYACHSYGTNNLGALLKNPHTVWQGMNGSYHVNPLNGASC